jgi:hypothetical protein
VEDLKAQINRLKKDNFEKDSHILLLKKRLDMDKDKKATFDKVSLIE